MSTLPKSFYLHLWDVYHYEGHKGQSPLDTHSTTPLNILTIEVPISDLHHTLDNIEKWYGEVCTLIYPCHNVVIN